MLLLIQQGPSGPGGGVRVEHTGTWTAHLPEQPDAPVDRDTADLQGVVVLFLLTQGLSTAAPWVAAIFAAFTAYVGVALAVALFHPDPGRRGHAARVLDRLLSALQLRRPR